MSQAQTEYLSWKHLRCYENIIPQHLQGKTPDCHAANVVFPSFPGWRGDEDKGRYLRRIIGHLVDALSGTAGLDAMVNRKAVATAPRVSEYTNEDENICVAESEHNSVHLRDLSGESRTQVYTAEMQNIQLSEPGQTRMIASATLIRFNQLVAPEGYMDAIPAWNPCTTQLATSIGGVGYLNLTDQQLVTLLFTGWNTDIHQRLYASPYHPLDNRYREWLEQVPHQEDIHAFFNRSMKTPYCVDLALTDLLPVTKVTFNKYGVIRIDGAIPFQSVARVGWMINPDQPMVPIFDCKYARMEISAMLYIDNMRMSSFFNSDECRRASEAGQWCGSNVIRAVVDKFGIVHRTMFDTAIAGSTIRDDSSFARIPCTAADSYGVRCRAQLPTSCNICFRCGAIVERKDRWSEISFSPCFPGTVVAQTLDKGVYRMYNVGSG